MMKMLLNMGAGYVWWKDDTQDEPVAVEQQSETNEEES
ncbi:MAG: hypothetical protein JWO07_39 [Candidatus Saccharibacteria bacterium]|nr:hypothetical protein [Candidatus Saccharibacteria bacterium]